MEKELIYVLSPSYRNFKWLINYLGIKPSHAIYVYDQDQIRGIRNFRVVLMNGWRKLKDSDKILDLVKIQTKNIYTEDEFIEMYQKN